MSHFLALTCTALARSIYHLAANAPHAVSVELIDQGLHNRPNHLRDMIQSAVDQVEPGAYDALLLVYGICGMSTVGLTARDIPLVMPRAHDCITLYLGSRQLYQEEFTNHPGTYWYSLEYLERQGSMDGLGAGMSDMMDGVYEEYVEKYGKDNADYLMEVMGEWSNHYERAVFIDTGLGDGSAYEAKARQQAQERGWTFQKMQGNRRLLKMLVEGDWTEDDFLVVPPGHTIRQTGDENLLEAVPL